MIKLFLPALAPRSCWGVPHRSIAAPLVAPYGTWKSLVTLDVATDETMHLGRNALDGSNTCWPETRPVENGRSVIAMLAADGTSQDIMPPEFSVGTSLHEYGTRDFIVAEGTAYFTRFADQRVYRQRPEVAPVAMTPEGDLRYGSKVFDGKRRRITGSAISNAPPSTIPTTPAARLSSFRAWKTR